MSMLKRHLILVQPAGVAPEAPVRSQIPIKGNPGFLIGSIIGTQFGNTLPRAGQDYTVGGLDKESHGMLTRFAGSPVEDREHSLAAWTFQRNLESLTDRVAEALGKLSTPELQDRVLLTETKSPEATETVLDSSAISSLTTHQAVILPPLGLAESQPEGPLAEVPPLTPDLS